MSEGYSLLEADPGAIQRTIARFRGKSTTGAATGLQRAFGYLVAFLRKNVSRPETAPLREAFERYLREDWDGGYVTMFPGFDRSGPSPERHFLSLSAAAARLGCAPDVVTAAVAKGLVTPVKVVDRGARSTFYCSIRPRSIVYGQRTRGRSNETRPVVVVD